MIIKLSCHGLGRLSLKFVLLFLNGSFLFFLLGTFILHWSRFKCSTFIQCCFRRGIYLSVRLCPLVSHVAALFQHHWTVHHLYPVDRPDPASQHDGAPGGHHLQGAAVRQQHPAAVPQHLPGARDVRVPIGGGPVRQAALHLPILRDQDQVDSTAEWLHHHWC